MSGNGKSNLRTDRDFSYFLKKELADFLTLSRGIIALVILSLSFIGKDAYIAVVILTLFGVATDIFDGRVARRYLDEDGGGKLGKYDMEIDTLFVLCILGYLSLSEIVIPRVVGLGLIGLALAAAIVYKRKPKILILIEVPSVIALLVITGLYDLKMFAFVIAPVTLALTIINRKRVLYMIFEYWPKVFSK